MRAGVAVVSAACAFGIWPNDAKAEPSPQADALVASSPSGHDANNWFPAEAAAPAATHPEADATSDEPKHVDGGVSPAPRASGQEPQLSAQAPNALTKPPAAPVVFRRSYGWQIVVADVSSVALTIAGGVGESDEVAGLGVAGYFLAAPVVHFAHRNVWQGFASLGLRVGGPLVGAAIGNAVADCGESSGEHWCGIVPITVGVFAGILGAMIVDAAVFAREDVPRPRTTAGFSWSPGLRLDRHGAGLAVGGQF
jgi:hypothetical protein